MSLSALALAGVLQASTSLYNGYARHDFKVSGLDALVVEPKIVAKGRPWIWRCEFFDHRPMLDLALLANGYHLAYINLGNTFGAPVPMAMFGRLYQELTGPTWHLNRRVVLEGFSRGGLYAYNWAVKNPDKVMAIYGDAPVCDFKTWPYGGQGAARSEDDWKQLIANYGFPNEQAALSYPFNPVDNLEVLAQAHVPIIHVVGDADETVPVKANTGLVEQRYKALHGTIKVIHKPGGLHHPHSLDDPTPLVEFLVKHQNDTLHAPPSTLIPAPNLESRYNSAGWNGRSWLDQFQDGGSAAKLPDTKIVLLGDSITQGFGGPLRQVSAAGDGARKRWLGEIANEGISGDRVQHVIWRVTHGALSKTPAKQIFIMIGINNFPEDSPAAVAKGIERLAGIVAKQCPKAQVLVQPIMPAGKTPDSELRHWTNDVNQELGKEAREGKIRLAFADHNYLLVPNGNQDPSMCAGDGVHIKSRGYEKWGEQLYRAILQSQ